MEAIAQSRSRGHLDTVVLLLENGEDALARDSKGNLAVHHAARAGHLETVVQLLEYDPETKHKQLLSKNKKGDTARVIAFYCAQYHIHKYLRGQEWQVLGEEPSSSSKISVAIEAGDSHLVQRLLIDDPTLLAAADDDGQPPLHVAVQERQSRIVRMLLDSGAGVETTGFHGWRILHIAASLGEVEMVDLALSQGADVNSRTDSHQTALHKAASSKSLTTVRSLIEAGAKPDAKNNRGMNALHIAAHQNDIDTVRFLVQELGMDLLARDQFGQTPAMWAEKSAHLDILSFLKLEERKIKRSRGARLSLSRGESWDTSDRPTSLNGGPIPIAVDAEVDDYW